MPEILTLNEVKKLIEIRVKQPAFHPNATQFTLHLPEGFFGFWRQAIDRQQNIFCITNLTKRDKELPLHHLNLYSGTRWQDLLTGQNFDTREHELIVSPYQSLWISNNM